MYYIIDKNSLYDRVDEEVSHAADQAYAESGESLYDAVLLTEKDRDTVYRLIDEAAALLVRRTWDISKYSAESDIDDVTGEAYLTGRMCLQFFVQDLDSTQEESVSDEVSRFLALHAATEIFRERRPTIVPQYATREQSALDNINSLVRKRTAPARS